MGNAIQLFIQASEERRRRVQTNYALTHMRCEGAHVGGTSLRVVPVTELLVDIPHLSLRTAAFCAAEAECGDNMSTRVRVLPLVAAVAAVLPSGKTNACNGRVENA